MATLMSDEVFHDVAYKAKNRNHLLAGIDEFLDAVTVLPPGEWDPTIRIEPPAAIPSQVRIAASSGNRKKIKKQKKANRKRDELIPPCYSAYVMKIILSFVAVRLGRLATTTEVSP